MPHGLKMQFAARYSEPRRAESMNDILPMWEQAALCITMRERLLIVLYNLRQKVRGWLLVVVPLFFSFSHIVFLGLFCCSFVLFFRKKGGATH